MNEAAERFVRVLIRRPHAYAFGQKYPGAPIPGLLFLDAEGNSIGTIPLTGDETPEEVRKQMDGIGETAAAGKGR